MAVRDLLAHFEDQCDACLSRLNGVSTMGNWSEWILFFLRAVEAQVEESRRRIGRIMALKTRYDNLVRGSSKAAILAIDFIMEHGFVSVSEVAKHTGTTYPRARSAIDSLVRLGVLTPSGRLRGRQVWEATELLHEIYEV